MELVDIKDIQALTDKFSCSGLVFQGNLASFAFKNLALQIWKDESQFSTLVKSKVSENYFQLCGIARLLNTEISEPCAFVKNIWSSLALIESKFDLILEAMSQDDFEKKYTKETGLQPIRLSDRS
jgi:hypothetical protein